MEVAGKTDNNILLEESSPTQEQQQKKVKKIASPSSGTLNSPTQQQQQHQQQQKTKRKHRRGKPKSKNANKPYKTSNWKFQVPRLNYNSGGSGGGGGGAGINHRNGARAKLVRSRSLVPYNTNKFLMEEHLADVPSALLTPSGRTRDSSFSVDSEDNYFFSLPEDEEEFLTKEFANVYEKARVERLDNLTKQQLIEECLSIEDRYSSDLTQRQQQLNIQRISAEFMSKIRVQEEKIRELSRENYNLRCQLMRSAAAAAASPPSAAAPIGAAYEPTEPTPMDSSSEDSESDSSSSSSSSSLFNNDDGGGGNGHRGLALEPRRRRSCSSRSSLSEYNGYIENNYVENEDNDILNNWRIGEQQQQPECERQQLLEAHMLDDDDDDSNQNADDNKVLNRFPSKSRADGTSQAPDGSKLAPTHTSQSSNEPDDSTAAASATVSSMCN